jgi:hypothetical protein
MRDDFQTLNVVQPIDAPWWDNYFTEFISENLVPITLRDEREFNYRLVPASNPPRPRRPRPRRRSPHPGAGPTPPSSRRCFLGFFGF